MDSEAAPQLEDKKTMAYDPNLDDPLPSKPSPQMFGARFSMIVYTSVIVIVVVSAFLYHAIDSPVQTPPHAYSYNAPTQSTPSEKSEAEAETRPYIPPTPPANEKNLVMTKDKMEWEVDDHYDYVRGSVINKSSRTVRYWKVTAHFYDKGGSIIDSQYTNALETLLPGASKRFEIMHAHLPEAKKVTVEVEEVEFAD